MILRFDDENKEWIVIDKSDSLPTDVKLPNALIEKLDNVKKDLKDDKDIVAICVGDVGSGKSTLMRLCCRYVSDDKFDPRLHIVKDVKDIKPVMKNAKPGDAVLIDESSGIFSSSDTLTKKTKYANLVLDVCRQKNLFIALCAPYFHRLGSSVAIDRSRFLLRTYFNKKNGKRGSMCYYSERRKEELYHDSKKNRGSLKSVQPNWRGNFGDDITNKDIYKEIKNETLNVVLDSLDGPDKNEIKKQSKAEILAEHKLDIVRNNFELTSNELSKLLKIPVRTIQYYRKKILDEAKAIEKQQQMLNLLTSQTVNPS